MSMNQRPRRLRNSPWIRRNVQETRLDTNQLVYPIFVSEVAGEKTPIEALPGQTRWGEDQLNEVLDQMAASGVGATVLFPVIAEEKKDERGSYVYDPEGLVPRLIEKIKKQMPDMQVMTDIALDPFSSTGHDGLVVDGEIVNDETVELLCEMAKVHAEAGCDFVAPSDMMDGRVGAIRETLDDAGHTSVGIVSYTAKYASAFYGPFRSALDSAPRFGDKKTYQMDPSNAREALREMELDEAEGADVLMVKPALAYLDVISLLAENTSLPIAAYNVSGEYAMIEAAAEKGWIDRDQAIFETLLSIRRAGARMIFSYHALEAQRILSMQ